MLLAKNHSSKPWLKEVKRTAIELRKSKVPLASSRKQLEMPKRILPMILQFAMQNPDSSISNREKDLARGANQRKVSCGTMAKMKQLLRREVPSLTAKA